ncbi:prephenate dehydratase domain-containing protein [Novosphingobium sp. KN65.2]|uniref:prephenate dehydratase domain-containing protein n=1 Tax=Novosphingobium sp. KN65.2 TaxID=1478134 RepID=UPI0005E1EEDC|nr:prephenate dehydratase domain-containing protein [Novosphingobium sp. KN65.2]CDO34093.1 putative Prephenate dehydratase [Novosphingobium sp. KN65.2]
MGLKPNLTLGALGGPNTFGGDASRELMSLYPEFANIAYFRTAEDGFTFTGEHDAMCAPQQMMKTGFHPGINAYVADQGSQLYVIAETTHVYHCSLLLQPGVKMENVVEVRGHTGSMTQCRDWIEANLPQAKITIVHTSSHEAAREALSGDGTIASVGTPGMAEQFGLEQAAKDIDGGSCANYWAISPHRLFSDAPNRIVVAGRFSSDGATGRLIAALMNCGYDLRSTFTKASGEKLYEYDYLFWFGGHGELSAVQAALGSFGSARLAGAYEARD